MAIGKKKERLTLREKKKLRLRKRISGTDECPRLSVFRSGRHTYAQLISDSSGVTFATASTLEPEVREVAQSIKDESSEGRPRSTKSVLGARAVGLLIARRGSEKRVQRVVFDRNGFLYHGRIRAVADGAREGGLQF